MNTVSIVVCIVLATSMLHAQVGCISQQQPLRPPTAGANAALLCLCAQNNSGCRWQWAASSAASQPAQLPRSAPVQTDTSIYRITPVQPLNPLDMAIKAEQIRALRLENEQRRREIQAVPVAPPASSSSGTASAGVKAASLPSGDGKLWGTMSRREKLLYLNAIASTLAALHLPEDSVLLPGVSLEEHVDRLDRFYAARDWQALLPILDALRSIE